jgi:hypothetical protein
VISKLKRDPVEIIDGETDRIVREFYMGEDNMPSDDEEMGIRRFNSAQTGALNKESSLEDEYGALADHLMYSDQTNAEGDKQNARKR